MFDSIVGNYSIKKILEKSILEKKTSHSYLFVGMQGIGKKLMAVEFAKALLGINQIEKQIEEINHPDFICIEPDGNGIKIEQIRELQKKIPEKPIQSTKKVYLINEADSMTFEAQNCFLKTLEEPPEFVTIILIGSQESAFLPTIKSRCMIFHFQPIQEQEMRQYLEKQGITNLTNHQLEMFQGSIGKALSLKDKQPMYELLENMVNSLNKKDLIDILKISEPLYQAKEEIFEILEYINLLLLKRAKENYLYTNCIQIVENTKKMLKQNVNYDMCIDNLIINMWEEVV